MSNTVASAVKPTVDHLMDAPLDDLLAEFNVLVEPMDLGEAKFTGYMAVLKSGRLLMALPDGRPQAEREMVVRSMLGQAFHVQLPDLPDPYQLSAFDENGDPYQVNPRRAAV